MIIITIFSILIVIHISPALFWLGYH